MIDPPEGRFVVVLIFLVAVAFAAFLVYINYSI
jgi:hypothetical protein